MARTVGVARLVYNLALEQRRDHWRNYKTLTGKNLSYVFQASNLTALRAEVEWIKDVSVTAQQQALRDLDKAFVRFFKGLSSYPTFRRKGVNDSARFQGTECAVQVLNSKWAEVFLPKIGRVLFRLSRPLYGDVNNVTISLKAGQWHIAFACEREIIDPQVHAGEAVGIDFGVVSSVALSIEDIQPFHLPVERLNVLDRQRKRAQKKVARGKRGSNRNKEARRRVAALSAKIARVRRHWQNETTTALAKRFSVVVLEDLKIKNMTATAAGTVKEPGKNVAQKAGLNRSILNQGWGEIGRQLEYKMAALGGRVVYVDPRHTSQTCSACGHVAKGNRESQAVFLCLGCGTTMNADVNAAKVILGRWNTPFQDAEGSGVRPPCEASTESLAA